MKSNLISKSESSQILDDVASRWKMELPKTKNLRMHQITDDAQLISGQGFKALKIGSEYLPFLSETEILEKFPSVTVDMGAVKFMCNGANVMRPGIKKFSEFEEKDIVCIVEESQHKFLAVGRAMMSSSDAESAQKGEVLSNMHYISDRFWESVKTIDD